MTGSAFFFGSLIRELKMIKKKKQNKCWINEHIYERLLRFQPANPKSMNPLTNQPYSSISKLIILIVSVLIIVAGGWWVLFRPASQPR